MNNFTEVARTDEIPVGKMKAVTADGRDILVVNCEGKYYAIGRFCTHQKGDLAAGILEGKTVTCPRHGSRFDVTTGIALAGPKIALMRFKTGNEPTYEVKVEGEFIKVRV